MCVAPGEWSFQKAAWEGGAAGPKGGKGSDSGCAPSQQLSGLLQVCVRTGTETQAKFTSVEQLREYISVRCECMKEEGQVSSWGTWTGIQMDLLFVCLVFFGSPGV